jgi:hypothetical protein
MHANKTVTQIGSASKPFCNVGFIPLRDIFEPIQQNFPSGFGALVCAQLHPVRSLIHQMCEKFIFVGCHFLAYLSQN